MKDDHRDIDDVASVLEQPGLDAIAARLVHLHRLTEDDPEEPGISIESLRGLASFLQHEPRLPNPRLGVGPDGIMQVEWRIAEDGILALKFLPSGFIRLAAISPLAKLGRNRRRFSATLPASRVWESIRPFTDLLVRPADDRQDHP